MLPAVCRKSANMAGLLGYTVSILSSCIHQSQPSEQKRLRSDTEPYIQHKTLHTSDLAGKDLVIIGDVHGCYDEMIELMNVVRSKAEKPLVTVFVGDMINKGPKSQEMLDYVMNAKDTFCVRGNHEAKILKEYAQFKANKCELQESRKWVENLSLQSLSYLKSLPYTLSIPSLSIIVVHAGLVPGINLHRQNANSMLNMRNLMWVNDDFHGQVREATYRCDMGQPWADQWRGPEHVYFGHDAVRKLQLHEFTTGLDTGCVYGGKLTCVLFRLSENECGFTDKEIISIDPFKVYKPVSD